jgi:hypothetical protein
MTIQEAVTPADVAAADALARQSLIDAATLAALAARGCVYPDLFAPSLSQHLACINIGDETKAELRVFAVDKAGNVRTGPRGPMTAADALDELLAEHDPAYTRHFTR